MLKSGILTPRKKNTMLRDCMKYFNYMDKDMYFQARWWYTFRSFIKRCINARRNNAIELTKKKIMTSCKCCCIDLYSIENTGNAMINE